MRFERHEQRGVTLRPWRTVSVPPSPSTRPARGRVVLAALAGAVFGAASGTFVSVWVVLLSENLVPVTLMDQLVIAAWLLGGITSAICGGTLFGGWVVRRFFGPRAAPPDPLAGAGGMPLRGRWLACFLFGAFVFVICPATITAIGVWLST